LALQVGLLLELIEESLAIIFTELWRRQAPTGGAAADKAAGLQLSLISSFDDAADHRQDATRLGSERVRSVRN
jgi:hypothetical protein